MDFGITEQVEQASEIVAYTGGAFLLLFCAYEYLLGRYRDGRKTSTDWAMAGLALGALALVQRPLLMLVIFVTMSVIFPQWHGVLAPLEQAYFWPLLVAYALIDEYLHGRTHLFTHSPSVKTPWLRKVQDFYKIAHRPHHLSGGPDNRGELTATHTYVEHWGWWLILPNYWFGLLCLYLGLFEVFIWGTLAKAIWGMHVHTNWGRSYDLYLLNHRWAWVRGAMFALCHVFTFPNMHHQHHSRGANAAKNMTNFISLFDWLLWNTLVIERDRPAIYGWRQSEQEIDKPLYRFFNTDLRGRGG